MLSLIFITVSLSAANWNPAWYDQTEIAWSTTEPTATDPVGISVFCGLGHFTKKTRILISIQNRTEHDVCFSTPDLIDPSEEDNKKIQNATLGFKASILRAVVKSKLNVKEAYQQKPLKGISCRFLQPSKSDLPLFQTEQDRPACLAEKSKLAAGNIFEGSYEFIAPGVDIIHFELKGFSDCAGRPITPEQRSFSCKRP